MSVVSCCLNEANNAWVTLDDQSIYCNYDIANPNTVWERIGGGLIQISCNAWSTHGVKYIAGVNTAGNVYVAKDRIYKSPNLGDNPWGFTEPGWVYCSNAGLANFVSILPSGGAYIITKDNKIKLAIGKLIDNPVFDRTISLANGLNVANPIPTYISTLDLSDNGQISIIYYDGNNPSNGTIAATTRVDKDKDGWPDSNEAVVNPDWAPPWGYNKRIVSIAADKSNRYWFITPQGQLLWRQNNTNYPIAADWTNFTQVAGTRRNTFIAVTTDNTLIYGINGKDIKHINRNGLSYPVIYGKTFYGNYIPVTLPPYRISLFPQDASKPNLPMLHWRRDIEWKYVRDNCNTYWTHDRPYSDAGWALDGHRGEHWWKSGGGGKCWVYNPGVTHVFGQAFNYPLIYFPDKTQFGLNPGSDYRNALEVQLIPVNKKVANTHNNSGNLNDLINFTESPPSFSLIEFNIPNPNDPVDIDTNIPWILIKYYEAGQLQQEVLADWMKKYAYTPIVEDGITKPRYAQTRPRSSVNSTLPNNPINYWKNFLNGGAAFDEGALGFCSGDMLTTQWCNDYCSKPTNNCDVQLGNFCKLGSNKGLLPILNTGEWTNTPIPEDVLKSAYPKYYDEKTKNTCACFMDAEFYNLLDVQAFQRAKSTEEDFYRLFNAKGIGGKPRCDPFTRCNATGVLEKRADTLTDCPPVNIQTCIMKNYVNIEGGAAGNTFANNQKLNCTQNVTNTSSDKKALPTDQIVSGNEAQEKERIEKAAIERERVLREEREKLEREQQEERNRQSRETAAKELQELQRVEDEKKNKDEQRRKANQKRLDDQKKIDDQKKKNKQMIVIMIVLIILLLLGGGGAFVLMSK